MVGESAGGGGGTVSGVEPPGLEGGAVEGGKVDREAASGGGIDHGVGAVGIAGSDEAVAACAGPGGGGFLVGEDGVIGDAGEEGSGFHEFAAELHLGGAGLMDGVVPGHERGIDGWAIWGGHLPYRVMAVGMAEGTGEEVPIEWAADIGGDGVALFAGVEGDRVIFVDGLAIEDGFNGGAVIVFESFGVAVEFRDVSILAHIEVEPGLVMEGVGGAVAAGGVKGDEVLALVAEAEAFGHGGHDGVVGGVFDGAIAAGDPDDIVGAVALTDPLAVGFGVFGGEDFGAGAPLLIPFITPGGEEADPEAEGVGLIDDEVDVVPVVVIGAVDREWLSGVIVEEGEVAVGVGGMEAVEFGEGDGLDDRETFTGAVFEVERGFFAIESMEEFPGGIAEVEEGLVVVESEEALVSADLEAGGGWIGVREWGGED